MSAEFLPFIDNIIIFLPEDVNKEQIFAPLALPPAAEGALDGKALCG